MNWEGSELCFYINGESYAISLSNTQFAVISKILGLSCDNEDNKISLFSDDTLKRFTKMTGNPLNLRDNHM